jgi:hypothetical protein
MMGRQRKTGAMCQERDDLWKIPDIHYGPLGNTAILVITLDLLMRLGFELSSGIRIELYENWH